MDESAVVISSLLPDVDSLCRLDFDSRTLRDLVHSHILCPNLAPCTAYTDTTRTRLPRGSIRPNKADANKLEHGAAPYSKVFLPRSGSDRGLPRARATTLWPNHQETNALAVSDWENANNSTNELVTWMQRLESMV